MSSTVVIHAVGRALGWMPPKSLRSRFFCGRQVDGGEPDGRAQPRITSIIDVQLAGSADRRRQSVVLRHLGYLEKLRWRIERDYQELKQELRLGDYEGHGWRGFHHHRALART
jgi:hypothetical protein